LVTLGEIRGDLHCHTTWSDGRESVYEMGLAARELGYEYLAICDHTPAVGAVPGLGPDDVRRQAEEIAAANERLAPFRVLRDIEAVIEAAKRHGKAIEINGLPDRIDLRDAHVRLAVEAGVPVVCSTDAHSLRGLGNMRNAVATARRGWATAAGVLNTRPLDEILS